MKMKVVACVHGGESPRDLRRNPYVQLPAKTPMTNAQPPPPATRHTPHTQHYPLPKQTIDIEPMTMHIPPAIAIVMAMTVSLGTTIILCNGTTMMAVSVSAFAFSSSVLRRHPAAHPPHRGTVTGRRRRRPLSPPSSTDAATTTIKTTPISHQHLFLLNSSNNDNENNSAAAESVDTNNPADELLNKARRLRQEISTIESSKLQAQNEKDIQVQAKLAAEEADRQQNEQARLRYSAIVPILKDMGEEVLERVDFPPRVKGGKFIL